jgi:hypothetical protein
MRPRTLATDLTRLADWITRHPGVGAAIICAGILGTALIEGTAA